jgi:hypothetical protein
MRQGEEPVAPRLGAIIRVRGPDVPGPLEPDRLPSAGNSSHKRDLGHELERAQTQAVRGVLSGLAGPSPALPGRRQAAVPRQPARWLTVRHRHAPPNLGRRSRQ